MSRTTIRVSTRTRDLLQSLAQQSGVSMQLVLESALEQYRHQRLLDATNAAYAALHADPVATTEEVEEWRRWDQTIADGLVVYSSI